MAGLAIDYGSRTRLGSQPIFRLGHASAGRPDMQDRIRHSKNREYGACMDGKFFRSRRYENVSFRPEIIGRSMNNHSSSGILQPEYLDISKNSTMR
jgi:hypothetical protein